MLWSKNGLISFSEILILQIQEAYGNPYEHLHDHHTESNHGHHATDNNHLFTAGFYF